MRPIRYAGRFERDMKRVNKRGLDANRLWQVVDAVAAGRKLEPRHRPHKLSGEWAGCWECHVSPDWLLIWLDKGDEVVLLRTGTHADLFE